jgi:hypothetical protein
MTSAEKASAKAGLLGASTSIRNAINLSNRGQNGDALREYRKLFGELFPLP